MNGVILAASVSTAAEQRCIDAIPAAATWLEVDASHNGCHSPERFRSRFAGVLSYSLGAPWERNRMGSAADRQAKLQRAPRGFDIIDLNAATDLEPETLRAIPEERRMITWEGQADSPAMIVRLVEKLTSVGARYYRVVVRAETFAETVIPLAALKCLGRRDVLVYAAGEIGFWTRLIAPCLGAPMVFGGADDRTVAQGQPSIQTLASDYGLPRLPPINRVYGIIGSGVAHSRSPRLHNMAYRAGGHAALFVPFAARSLSEFWAVVVAPMAFEQLGLTLGGLTVASPFKEEAATLPISHSALAARAKSSNLIVRSSLGIRAESTDPESFQVPLAKRQVLPAGQRVAVIGCGGSGRAIAAALDLAGAHVTLVNRSVDEGRRVASFLRLPFVALSEFEPRGCSMIVNATPVGREEDALPFRVADLDRGAIVLDLVYGDQPTPLVREAIAAGHVVVDGNEVLAAQVRRQFESMTGFCMDVSE